MTRPWRKPLIVMSPKSLLRHPKAVSGLDEMSEGRLREESWAIPEIEPGGVRRVVACSGKLYYELRAALDEAERRDLAIIRFEAALSA